MAGDVDLLVVEAEHGGHGAFAFVGGGLHGIAPLTDEADPVGEIERTGGGQRRVLAKGVTGVTGRRDAEPFDGVQHDQAEHERRHLGVAGLAEFLGFGMQEQCGDIPLGGLGRLGDELPRRVVDPRFAHARLLRPLTGVGEHDHEWCLLQRGGCDEWCFSDGCGVTEV